MVELSCLSSEHVLPRYQIFTDQTFSITVRVFGWMLIKEHHILTTNKSSFLYVTPSNFIKQLEKMKLCNGIDSASVSNSVNIVRHIVPKKFDFKRESK